MKIVFATRNKGKVKEVKEMLQGIDVELFSLSDYDNVPEIVEDGATFLENALKKARTISVFTKEKVLADDSGLQVDILGGEPGIKSARYAGINATDDDNNRKLLVKLKGIPPQKRKASFFCALVLCDPDGKYKHYEASWRGVIVDAPRGENGFGYDPIFMVPDLQMTAAELPPEIKNEISHRGQAFALLRKGLKIELEKK